MVPHPLTLVRLLACCATLAVLCARPAVAQDEAAPTGFFERDSLTNGWFGEAPALKDKGVVFTATEIGEVLSVASGGSSTGTIYEGRLELDLDLDLDHILGLPNSVLHASAYQIHGRGLSGNYIAGNLQTVSSIEATRSSRLFDLWIERGFFDNALSVRIGQIAADDEFITSQYAGGLLNATFGWPAIMAQALPSGGPVYPLATPGLRVKYAFTDAVALQVALINGDPAGGDPGDSAGAVDPQTSNADGLRFPVDHSPFVIAELSYAPGAAGSTTQPTVYKLGLWRQGGRYDDLAVDGAGRSLADPSSNGVPRGYDGNFGIYAIADLLLSHPGGSDDRVLAAFFRIAGDPGDRNFVSFYVDGGLNFKGLLADRTDDVASLGFSYAQVSGSAGSFIHDLQLFSGVSAGAPDYQAVLEASYQITLAPWWSVQPDIQMVFHPTAVVVRPSPSTAVSRIGNALVAGLRTSIRF